MEVPYLAIKIVSQYSPLLISTLHLAFPFALSQRKYFQQNAFLLLETSSNWSSLNMEIESENKFTNFILKKKVLFLSFDNLQFQSNPKDVDNSSIP